ncbi:isocitrate lyase/PEP mutase family protein [Burkholderia cenocepacia]|uniref:isocitrate lyase/PEP mutase family protein n=1 Tax=Burkholderia cenocepacia TaxID=95486 RepID=UPI0019052C20|nr:isocitrate lyase/PEP mutase family protein [Burkholderia cenocepacia]MBJ9698535.1 isocitrate lyase/PEP mutase family protein [Burkholderia cenocepacia]
MTRRQLKLAGAGTGMIRAPGVYDGLSARVAESIGFDALYVTGYGVSFSLGHPDAGLVTYSEMVERIAIIADVTDIPLICDADTGFGGVANIRRTVRGYESAGAAAIQIEDQISPKKCGHTDGRLVAPAEEMEVRIKVAVDSRRSEHTQIIARTDARTTLGLSEAIDRAGRYAEAGADVLFIEAPENVDELVKITASLKGPLLVNMVVRGKTPMVSARQLEDMGFAIAIYPSIGFASIAHTLAVAYRHLKEHPDAVDFPVDFYGQSEAPGALHRLAGFPEVWDLERRFEINR